MALNGMVSQHSTPSCSNFERDFFDNLHAFTPAWWRTVSENMFENVSPLEQTPPRIRPFSSESHKYNVGIRVPESPSARETSSSSGNVTGGEENASLSYRRGSLGCKSPDEIEGEEDLHTASQVKAASETLYSGVDGKRTGSKMDVTSSSTASCGSKSTENSKSPSNATLQADLLGDVSANSTVRKCEMSYVVEVPLDGFRPADLTLSARDGKLRVIAVRQERREGEDWRCAMLREYALPSSVDLWHVNVRIDGGRTLVVSMPFGTRAAGSPATPVGDADDTFGM